MLEEASRDALRCRIDKVIVGFGLERDGDQEETVMQVKGNVSRW
jgi:hypothetical protein